MKPFSISSYATWQLLSARTEVWVSVCMRICAIGLSSGHISPLPVWPCPPDPHQHSLSIHLLPTHVYFTLLHPSLLSSLSPPSPPIWPSEAGGGRWKQLELNEFPFQELIKNLKSSRWSKNKWLKRLLTKTCNMIKTSDMTGMTLKPILQHHDAIRASMNLIALSDAWRKSSLVFIWNSRMCSVSLDGLSLGPYDLCNTENAEWNAQYSHKNGTCRIWQNLDE